jgi:PAS domain S-box-containing protein
MDKVGLIRLFLALGIVAIALGVVIAFERLETFFLQVAESNIPGTNSSVILGLLVLGVFGAAWLGWWLTKPLLVRLQKAELLSSSIIAVLVDAIIVIDQRGRILVFSPAAERLFGYAKEEVLGRNVNVLMPEPDASAHDGYIQRYLRDREARVIGKGRIVSARRKSGETFPARLSVGELSTSREAAFVGILSDVSEQHAAQRKIQQLAQAIDASADAVYITDRDGLIEFVNPAFTALTGLSHEQAIGLSPRALESERMPPALQTAMWEALARGDAWRGRVLNRRAIRPENDSASEAYWTDTTITPFCDDNGSIAGYVAIQQDISERVSREEADALGRECAELRVAIGSILHSQQPLADKLRQSLAALLALQGLTLQQRGGIFLRSADGTQLEMSVLLGHFSDDFIRCEQCVPLGSCLCGRAAVSGEVLVSDDCFCDPRHERRYDGMTAHGHYIIPLKNGDNVLGVLFLYTDPHPLRSDERIDTLRLIGEMMGLAIANHQLQHQLINARDAALEAARVKSQFLANMSHEIRTPMNGVLGMLDLLRDSGLSHQNAEFAATAYNSAVALLEILNDILDYSKIEAGKLDLEQIDFDLQDLIGDIGAIFAERAANKGLELICYADPELPRILRGDPTRLRQILVNLIGNALKFTEQGEVALNVTGLHSDDDPVRLSFSIRDTGIGISSEAQAKLFHSFIQADGSTTRKYGGTGLGLSICKQLVELMGGRIAVDSVPGQGSRFWFDLALARGDENLPAFKIANDNKPLRGLRMLIVDDNATNRQILEHYLNSWSIEHASAENALSGLNQLRQASVEGRPFVAAIIDMAMPGMDGLSLARRIKDDPALANMHLVMLSSIGLDVRETREVGIERWLIKPVRQSALFDALVGILAPALCRPPQEPLPPRGPSFQGRILLVEDNRVNQLVVTQWLARFGLTPDIANNGREALAKTARQDYDLIFMDCQMPEMDGYQATRAIREQESATHGPRRAIVAMTAGAMREDRDLCLTAGMDDYVTKPLTREVLIGVLERWLLPVDLSIPPVSSASRTGGNQQPEIAADAGIGNAIDSVRLDSLRELMQDDFGELLASFLDHTPRLLEQLADAIAEGDPGKQANASHPLKSSAAIFGAGDLAILAEQAETSGLRGIVVDPAFLERIRLEFEKVRDALPPPAGGDR